MYAVHKFLVSRLPEDLPLLKAFIMDMDGVRSGCFPLCFNPQLIGTAQDLNEGQPRTEQAAAPYAVM